MAAGHPDRQADQPAAGPGLDIVFEPVVDIGAVLSCLAPVLHAVIGEVESQELTWLDTADWRVSRADASLCEERTGRRRELVLRVGDQTVRGPAGRVHWPAPISSLPNSPLRKRLRSLAGPRAVLPLATVEVRRFPVRLLDGLDKTRVRGSFTQYRLLTPHRQPLAPRLELTPLRGYHRDGERAIALLASALPTTGEPPSAAQEALLAAGHRVGRYAGQGPVSLDPHASAATGVALVLLDWLDVLVANRDAAASGLDSESLHDLRVALRASRSLLKDTGDLLPNDLSGRFGAKLAELARSCSRARELDVALLSITGQGALAVEGLAQLGELRDWILRRRASAFRTLSSYLRSSEVQVLLDDWRATLVQVVEVDPPGSTIAEVAAVRIRSAYQALLRALAEAAAQQPLAALDGRALHELRKQGKSLRYLVQCTRSLADPEAYAQAIRSLTALQDRLGTVQDAAELRDEVRAAAARWAKSGVATPEPLLTAGAVLDRLRTLQTVARAELGAVTAELSSPKTGKAFATLIMVKR